MIFSGIEILFFSLGVITTLALGSTYYYNTKLKFNWGTWLTISIGILLFIFGIAWAFSSILEGEPRAASMGIVVFIIPSIIFIVLGRRLALKNQQAG